MRLLIRGGHVFDPSTEKDGIFDILVEDGIIKQVAENIRTEADIVRDASGLYVMPGLIDLHTHLRDPGQEYKETLRTGAMAAARGGLTTICAMPNTSPATDSPEKIRSQVMRAKEECPVNISFIGAVTKGQEGRELADIAGMKREGALCISEDGKSVEDAGLYREAMRIAAGEDVLVMAHCEDKSMAADGVMNAGEKAKELGFPGITNSVEDVIIARDIILAKETGARLHLCHCSTKDSVRMVKLAKEAGVKVTAEVCPHYLFLADEDIPGDDADYKMNPPLRSREDVKALTEGLKEGTMDAISTDHAPHGEREKSEGFAKAPFGITGLETSVPLVMTELVHAGILTPMEMAERMSFTPARILGIDKGSLAEGKCADITITDPDAEYVIERKDFVSKGKNTPFEGRRVRGRVVMTIVGGKIVYEYNGIGGNAV